MSDLNTFALVGVGTLGSLVAEELLLRGVSLKILSRDVTQFKLQTFRSRGVELVTVDYTNQNAVQHALEDVDVVVSTISFSGLSDEITIVRAAKAAGVKLFVPSEYGLKLELSEGTFSKPSHDVLRDLDLPSTFFYAGFFAEEFAYYLGYDYEAGYMRIVGAGNKPFSVTACPDIARFVAHVLTTANATALAWAEISIEGDRKSPMEIRAIATKKFRKLIHVAHVDYEMNAVGAESNIVALLGKIVEDGSAVTASRGKVNATIEKFFPDWNPRSLDDFI